MKNTIKIGISIGDMNGIGLEVILKALHHKRISNLCTPVIYGSSKLVAYHKNITEIEDFQFQGIQPEDSIKDGRVSVVNCWKDSVNIKLGEVCEEGGKYARLSLESAVADLRSGKIDALVTAPIHKKAMNLAKFAFPGHTEFLTKELGSKESLMFMVNDDLRVGLVTNHLPLAEVASSITKERIMDKLKIMNETLRMDFGIEKPNIAVLGLNPHAGDEGVLGKEEIDIIRPAVVQCKKNGIMAFGPFAADGFFGSDKYRKYDAILAMYHDQGLVPFKALSFGNGVNYTAGLSHIRTSPDHGTGMDIAGKNIANPASFRRALYLAIDLTRNRKDYLEMTANPVKKAEQRKEKY